MGNGVGIAEGMKGIAEDIMGSYDIRVKTLGDLVTDTRRTLKEFASDRKKMGREQAKNLADFVEDLSKNVGNMLEKFGDNHSQMSKEQAKSLTDFVKNLGMDVGSMLDNFQKDRTRISKELRKHLAKEVRGIEIHVKKKLQEFKDAHAEMSDEMKRDLDNYVGDIVSSVKKLLGEYGSDMKKARAAWQNMASTLAKARGNGAIPRIEARERVATVGEAINKSKKKRKNK